MIPLDRLRKILPAGVRHGLGRMRRQYLSRRSAIAQGRRQFLASRKLSSQNTNLVANISCNIDADDGMFKGDMDHYLSVGLSAVSVIAEALAAAPEVRS
ncbi:MAG: hypothetical protein ABIP78_01705, partial [Pyrinomonadaceae bacterium]